MPRDYRLYLEDMSGSLRRLQTLTSGMSYDEFCADLTRQEAAIRNLEIIGEASRNVPEAVRSTYPDVDWAGSDDTDGRAKGNERRNTMAVLHFSISARCIPKQKNTIG